MKSLFIRIFLWFWLAMTLVIAAFVISVLGTARNPPPPNPETLVSHMLDTVGQASLEALRRDGPAGVREFVQRVSSPDEIRLSVFHAEYPALSPDRVPEHVRGLIDKAQKDTALHRLEAGQSLVYAKQVSSPAGTLVAVFEAPQFQGLLTAAGDPRALGLRIVAVVLVAGLVCFWLARSITAPLRRLGAATSQFAKGHLSVRVGPELVRRGDELAELARGFDRMADEIDTLVTSQRRLLRDVSHELRSPLARLNVALALARQKSAPDALDRIECEAERLGRLIGRLLTLARCDARPDQLRKEVDAEALIETIVQDAQFEADSRRVSVQVDKAQACSVLGHPDLLYAALENVVRNAVRYTHEGTSVEISLEWSEGERGPEVRIRVRDHGPGVPEDELNNILQPFYSVAGGHSSHQGGTGLGLSIVDRAVQQLGGRISLCNAAEGGLIFDIYLPRVTNPSSS